MPRAPRLKPGYRLLVEDCVRGMAGMPEKSVDVVVTSPPYNLGIRYGKYRDKLSGEEYLEWSKTWARAVRRVLKSGGSFFLNLGASPSNPLIPYELAIAFSGKDVGFVLQNTFHWIKSISLETRDGRQISAGHFKPINSRRYVNDCHEYIFHFTPAGSTPLNRLGLGVPYSDKSNVGRWAHTDGLDLRCRGNNWFIPYATIFRRDKQRPHPATFPVELAANCLKIHGCKPSSTVLDPFVGIGHSALAAKKFGIKSFTGFDIDPAYVKAARKNLLTQP